VTEVRARRTVILLLLAAAMLAVVPATSAQAGARSRHWSAKFLTFTNDYRTAHGVHRLSGNADLRHMAWRHSVAMAKERRLFHTYDLDTKLLAWHPSTWGENIGVSTRLWRMFKGFCDSAPHRANLLNAKFGIVGIGVAFAHGGFWVTMDFVG
jgi:uncharacterized protein YkwD